MTINTPFSKRVEILGQFYAWNSDNDDAVNSPFYLEYADTMWICLASNVGYVTIEDKFHPFVDDAWQAFILFLGLDIYGEYDSLVEMIELAEWENEQV